MASHLFKHHHPLTVNQVASVFDLMPTTRQVTVTEDGKPAPTPERATTSILWQCYSQHTPEYAQASFRIFRPKASPCRIYRAQSAAFGILAPTNAGTDSRSKVRRNLTPPRIA